MGCTENKVEGRGRPKLVGETSIYSKGARVRGFEAVSEPFDLDQTVRIGGVLGGLQVGCDERVWTEGREERCSPAAVSETENVRR